MHSKTQKKIKSIDETHEKNLQNEIKKCLKTSEKIDKIIKSIYKTVELTKMNATEEFKSFIEPKTSLDSLSEFYEIFIKCDDKLQQIREKDIKIQDIEQIIENLNVCNDLYNIIEDLKNFEKVVIVQKLLRDTNQTLEPMMNKIEVIFFQNLGRNLHDTVNMNKVALFLIEKRDTKTFLGRYSNELYSKVNFDDIKFNKKMLLQQTGNIDRYIYDLNVYNKKILGETTGSGINLGLNKILIINLTKIIGDILQVIEREEKLEDVPFLMTLNNHLKHTEENKIKEIESLFVFKDPINKIICNIFLAYTSNVDRLDAPNKFCDVEILAINLRRALDSLNSYKILTKIFLNTYGPLFKIKTLTECNDYFTKRLVCKILKFSEPMPNLKKFIYLINNLYTLQNYISEDLKSKIGTCSDNLVKTFNEELQKRNQAKLTSFIDLNISAFKSYYLPDDIRIGVVSLLKKSIWEEIGKKGYEGDLESLNSTINEMFIGK
ncbi:ubiquitin-protein ligase [Vairimorpha ceranae]|uniref:Ubiquitin-protein ligase n=1 Tax=Vairimorpha ceranae TaxID=40302 RepID=A0A0F9ZFC8_9MICR|nr:ubiquitin-protein ligase [Vairimorpha ceranae]KAF5141241.1 hypothetical protein G9O61_00g005580 [Vairimorpha ceranae]KKO76094.1 ubiquitin-protein ligase [Vairimorpha ceranae]